MRVKAETGAMVVGRGHKRMVQANWVRESRSEAAETRREVILTQERQLLGHRHLRLLVVLRRERFTA